MNNYAKSIFVSSVIVLCGCTESNSGAIVSEPGRNVVVPDGLPFSEFVQVDNTIYLSGQIGLVPGDAKIIEGGIEAETRQTMENIKAVLEAQGHSLNDIIKCTVMIDDISQWGAFNKIYASYFSGKYPARSAFGVDKLAMGAAVEVECIAVVNRN